MNMDMRQIFCFCSVFAVFNCYAWQVVADFEEQWANGTIPGWNNEGEENGHVPTEHTVIDLDYYSTVEELMEVGSEKLKEVRVTICDHIIIPGYIFVA